MAGHLCPKQCENCGKTFFVFEGRLKAVRACGQRCRIALNPNIQKEYAKRYREKNLDKVRALDLERKKKYQEKDPDFKYKQQLRRYGLNIQQYRAMIAAQGGVCAICGKSQPAGHRLCVDHDHETGRVRALLCVPCNAGIGSFKENPNLLRAAIEYLIRHAAPEDVAAE